MVQAVEKYVSEEPPILEGKDGTTIGEWTGREYRRITAVLGNSIDAIEEASQELSDLSDRVDQNELDIAKNALDIAKNASLIALNASNIQQNSSDIQERMLWKGEWTYGTYYANDVVRDGWWTMIANKETEDRPSPRPIGSEYWLLDDNPTWETQSPVVTLVESGTKLVWPRAGYLEGMRIWIPQAIATYQYQVYISRDDSLVYEGEVITGDNLTEGWNNLPVSGDFAIEGQEYVGVLVTNNMLGATTQTFNYVYSSSNGDADPASGECHERDNRDWIRFNKTDNDSVDRSVALLGVDPGDTISTDTKAWTVTSVSDGGTYVEYAAVDSGGQSAGLDAFTFTSADPQGTDYVRIVDEWTVKPAVSGMFALDGADLVEDQNAYGVDFLVQEAYISEDWELVALSGVCCLSSVPDPIEPTPPDPTDPTPISQPIVGSYTGSPDDVVIDLGGQPHLVIIKKDADARDWRWYDITRGDDKTISSNANYPENTDTPANSFTFTDIGFTVGGGSGGVDLDLNDSSGGTYYYIAFPKDDAGFSIVEYTGTGTAQTIPHTLSGTPGFTIVKNLDSAVNGWYNASAMFNPLWAIEWNGSARQSNTAYWNNTATDTTSFYLGNNADVNANGDRYVAYTFGSSGGKYSTGSYTGTGVAGSINLVSGFSPRGIMVKKIFANTSNTNDVMTTTAMSTSNPRDQIMRWAVDNDIYANTYFDFSATGVTITSTNTAVNALNDQYFYLIF